MPRRLASVLQTMLDSAGNPIAGSVALRVAGTATPLTCYTDRALTVAAGSTIAADAAGRLPDRYVADTGAISVDYRDALGAIYHTVEYALEDLDTVDEVRTELIGLIGTRQRNQDFYGVVANGVADDTAAVQNMLNDQGARGDVIMLRGTILLTARLDVPVTGAHIIGAGVNSCVLRWQGGSSRGIRFAPTTGSAYRGFTLQRTSLETDAAAGGFAVDVDLPDGASANESRVNLQQLDYRGLGVNAYWTVGHRLKNVSYFLAQACRFLGSVGNPAAVAMAAGTWYGGQLARIETQTVSDDPALGLSLEGRHIACSAHFAQRGIEVLGYSEGQSIAHCDFAGVWDGVDCVAVALTRQPWINLTGVHVNAVRYGVRLDGYEQCALQGMHISRWPDAGTEAWRTTDWTGLYLDNSSDVSIDGASILAEASSSSAGTLTGIYVGTGSRNHIGDVSFKGGAGALKDMTTAVSLSSNSSYCNVSPKLRLEHVTTPITDAGFLNDRRQEAVGEVAPDNGSAPAVHSGRRWEVGDIVWKRTSTIGQPTGWLCVTAGTPGTWAALANL